LLCLRFSAAISLVLGSFSHGHGLPNWIQATAIFLSIALLAGYMTPIAAAIGLLCDGLMWFRLGVSAHSAILVGLDMTALALIGPGAFSADAYRYGRRILVPPPNRP
jgi:putative oxidoreductase